MGHRIFNHETAEFPWGIITASWGCLNPAYSGWAYMRKFYSFKRATTNFQQERGSSCCRGPHQEFRKSQLKCQTETETIKFRPCISCLASGWRHGEPLTPQCLQPHSPVRASSPGWRSMEKLDRCLPQIQHQRWPCVHLQQRIKLRQHHLPRKRIGLMSALRLLGSMLLDSRP